MEQITLYSIAYKGLKNGSYDFDFQVDDKLFEAYDRVEIKSGDCKAHVELKRSETMLELGITISGEVICECDRCLEDCSIPVEFSGLLTVRFSDLQHDYDGDVMWIAKGDQLSLKQYIYESIILSLPYRRVHEDGGCNPEMLAAFATISEEEFERMAAEADDDEVAMDDHNRELLEELKRKMEQTE